jgi:hypothetical protein
LNSFQQVKTGFFFEEKTLNMLGCPNQHSCRKKMALHMPRSGEYEGARFRPQAIKAICKSITFVKVGPVTNRSPVARRK